MNHCRIKAVREGIKRAHVDGETQRRVRRPLTWVVLKEMEDTAREWWGDG